MAKYGKARSRRRRIRSKRRRHARRSAAAVAAAIRDPDGRAVAQVEDSLAWAAQSLSGAVTTAGDSAVQYASDAATGVVDTVSAAVDGATRTVSDAAGAVAEASRAAVGRTVEALDAAGSVLVDGVVALPGAVVKQATDMVKAISTGLPGLSDGAREALLSLMTFYMMMPGVNAETDDAIPTHLVDGNPAGLAVNFILAAAALTTPFILGRKGGWADPSSYASAPESAAKRKMILWIAAYRKSWKEFGVILNVLRDGFWGGTSSASKGLPADKMFPIGRSVKSNMLVCCPHMALGVATSVYQCCRKGNAIEPLLVAGGATLGLFMWNIPAWSGLPTKGWNAVFGTAPLMGFSEALGQALFNEAPAIEAHWERGDFCQYFVHEFMPKLATCTPAGMVWLWSAILQDLSATKSLAYVALASVNLSVSVGACNAMESTMSHFWKSEHWKTDLGERDWKAGWRSMCKDLGMEDAAQINEWVPESAPLVGDSHAVAVPVADAAFAVAGDEDDVVVEAIASREK